MASESNQRCTWSWQQHLQCNVKSKQENVTFAAKHTIRVFYKEHVAAMITFDSGADGHYISEQDQKSVGLSILRPSTKRVGVTTGSTSMTKHVTQLPFPQLSDKVAQADTFEDFPTLLMRIGKTADDGTISIFTKDRVTVHKEEDVLIICTGEPFFIGIRDKHGKKIKDVFIQTYNAQETIFFDRTGKFPNTSLQGNKYIMVMVEIDSNAVLVEPMWSQNDAEMIRAYDVLIGRLKHANIHPKKHILDNKISANMKQHITDQYKLTVELVPPGNHRQNAAEVAICNFKAHFSVS
ncbi:hypothetical protein ACHAW6_011364 [Cyclotella cf. meneghiniana]